MRYEVILFDADETLFDFKKSEREAFKNAILELNIPYDENYHLKIYQEINTAIWKEFEEGLITQQELKVERFRRLSDALKIDFDAHAFAASYIKHLADASFLYEESLSLMKTLATSHKLLIVTNGLQAVQTKRIGESDIAKYLDAMIISEAVKVAKPNPRIFELALEAIGYTDKTKVLMVGDSLTSDIQGGINFGIDTCWYNPNQTLNKAKIQPTYEIHTLNQLKDLL